ncbi:unnamed protein product, partial [Vitis vinifera]|uniref:Uncharacterized protein n=1 Tax=Vitis vinifera TaxID=29760 RepID=D7T253_VITVI
MVINRDKPLKRYHVGIIQAMLIPPNVELVFGIEASGENLIDTTKVNTRLPMLVYVFCENRSDYDYKKKVKATNALVQTNTIMSNRSSILNLDRDHYTQIIICCGLISILEITSTCIMIVVYVSHQYYIPKN